MPASIGLAVLVAAAPAVARDAGHTPRDITFAIYRKGVRVGTHTIAFRREGERLWATTKLDIVVRLLGFPVYRYHHETEELWYRGRMICLRSGTNDDGERFRVQGSATSRGFVIRTGGQRLVTGASVLPTTYWHPQTVDAVRMIDTQDGTVREVEITPMGRERIDAGSGPVTTERFRFAGRIRFDLWRTLDGELFGIRYRARTDGSILRYDRID